MPTQVTGDSTVTGRVQFHCGGGPKFDCSLYLSFWFGLYRGCCVCVFVVSLKKWAIASLKDEKKEITAHHCRSQWRDSVCSLLPLLLSYIIMLHTGYQNHCGYGNGTEVDKTPAHKKKSKYKTDIFGAMAMPEIPSSKHVPASQILTPAPGVQLPARTLLLFNHLKKEVKTTAKWIKMEITFY